MAAYDPLSMGDEPSENGNGAVVEQAHQSFGNLVDVPHDEEDSKHMSYTSFEEYSVWRHFSFRKLWAFTGPGFLMSIAYLDPGNIESDLQMGANTGYSLLWVLFWSTVIGFVLQLLSARLGVSTGKHLAVVCRDQYPIVPRIILWLMIESAIIGSDIQEVVGSAIAINLLSAGHIPLYGGVLITALDTFTFLLLERKGIRKLEIFFGFLITVMVITFGVEYIMAKPNNLEVIKGIVIPIIPAKREGINTTPVAQAVATVGAVIMPHNLFLHSALVLSRKVNVKKPIEVKEGNFYNAIESGIALFVSFIVNLFVVGVFAATTFKVKNIGLSQAGTLLGEKYGTAARYIWALGLLAAGQSSTMTGTYAGQFVMEGFIKIKLAPWKRVLITRSIAIIPAIFVALLKSNQLDVLDEYLNVLQSIQLPFALIPVLTFTGSVAIMGKFATNKWIRYPLWGIALAVIAINLYIAWDIVNTSVEISWWVIFLLTVLGQLYLSFIIYLIVGPKSWTWLWNKCFVRQQSSMEETPRPNTAVNQPLMDSY